MGQKAESNRGHLRPSPCRAQARPGKRPERESATVRARPALLGKGQARPGPDIRSLSSMRGVCSGLWSWSKRVPRPPKSAKKQMPKAACPLASGKMNICKRGRRVGGGKALHSWWRQNRESKFLPRREPQPPPVNISFGRAASSHQAVSQVARATPELPKETLHLSQMPC